MNRVNEIFYSLQGEGFYTGTASVFVRFSGCNLNCSFCDTDFREYTMMSDTEISYLVMQYPSSYVVLTGGEPSLQVSEDLIDMLHGNRFNIAMETNGTNKVSKHIDWITLSPKDEGKVVIDRADEIKIVYQGQDVEEWIKKGKSLGAQHFFLQPCSGENVHETINYILAHPWWRLSLQTHKMVGIR